MARFQRLACPSCGGALDVPTEHEQFFKCATCGAALEDTQYEAPTKQVSVSVAGMLAQSGIDQATLHTYAARAARTATTAGKIVAAVTSVIVLAAVGGAAFGIYRAVDQAADTVSGLSDIPGASEDGFGTYNFSSSLLLGSGESSTSEVILITNGPDDQELHYVELGAATPLRWTTGLANLLPADESIAGYEQIAVTRDRVLITHEDHLYGFDRATGAVAYQFGLPDSITNYCTRCLRQIGDNHVAALTAEGTLQVWDATTGTRAWSVVLPGDVPRQLLDMAGNPAVITQLADGTNGIAVYDLATGAVAGTQSPSCAGSTSRLHPYDQLIELPGGGYLWSGGTSGGCLQRWSPGAGAPDWSTPVEPDPMLGRPNFYPDSALLTGDTMTLTTTQGLALLQIGDGALQLVPHADDVDQIVPIALEGSLAIVTEHYNRGTGRWRIAAIDLADPAGAMRWEVSLEGTDGSDSMITGDEWLVGSTPAGIAVVEFDVDANSISTLVVDPATGVGGAPSTFTNDDLTFTEFVGWRGNNVLLGFDDHLVAIDPATATVVASAP